MENIDFKNREAMTDLIRNDPEAFFEMAQQIKEDEARRQATAEGIVSEIQDESTQEHPRLNQQSRRKAMRIAFRR